MTKPCIICVAITGSVPRKSDNPAVPVTVSEQIESTHAAFEAGASIMHAHVRNSDETPSSDPEKFAALKEGVEKHCPGMITQFSTGGRSGAGKERGGMLGLKPDMASLAVGSNNFPTRVYENPPDLVDWLAAEMVAQGIKPEIEAFDLSHIFKAAQMYQRGQIFFGDTAASVLKADADQSIKIQITAHDTCKYRLFHRFGRYCEPPAITTCVPGVQGKIDKSVFKLMTVNANRQPRLRGYKINVETRTNETFDKNRNAFEKIF